MKRVTFRVTLVGLCSIIAGVTALAALGLQYYFSKQLAIDASQILTHQITKQIESSIQAMDDTASNTTSVVSRYSSLLNQNTVTAEADEILVDILNNNNNFYAMYYGFENGDFYELINLETNNQIRKQLSAAHQDRYVRIHIYNSAQGRVKQTDYLDEHLSIRHSKIEPSDYFSTTRHWFKDATRGAVHKSKPYLFQHLKATGKTYSRIVNGTNHVFAVDLTLKTIADQLNSNLQANNQYNTNEAYIYTQDGELLLTNQQPQKENTFSASTMPLTTAQKSLIASLQNITVSNELDWAPIDFAISGQPKGYAPEFVSLLAQKLGLNVDFVNGYSWLALVEAFNNNELDVLQPLRQHGEYQSLGYFSKPILDLPLALVTRNTHKPIESLDALNGQKLAIPVGWSFYDTVKTQYPEITIVDVDNSIDALRAVESGEVDAALDSLVIHTYTAKMYFIDGLSYHENLKPIAGNFDSNLRMVSKNKQLIELLDIAIDNITADERQYLTDKWLASQTNPQLNESSQVPYRELITLSQDQNAIGQLHSKLIAGKEYLVYITPTQLGSYNSNYLALMLPKQDVYAEGMAYVSKSILFTLLILCFLLPLTWLIASPIVQAMRELTVENEKIRLRQYNKLKSKSSFIVEINDVFKSLVSMSNSIQAYEKKQVELLDSFVKLIAQAIDDKSPYTAGHCNRVPELGLMLADAASNNQSAYFKSFELDTDDKKREFRLAAWLHDCGKVITPEHIVDKGSKLECIYNRLHEVRMRFEVILRDIELNYYRDVLSNPEQTELFKQEMEQRKAQLMDDFEFIAACNQGGEFMAPENIERLHAIAQQTWTRHFSDKIGLSPLEELNLTTTDDPLPVQEQLLADKSIHIIERNAPIKYAPHLGIKVEVPELKANQGELYNLSIGRGTLTAEDRFIINEHIIGTIKMLDSMPFPPELANVPRYASTHHETLKGTGYPRRLTGSDLSIPERILVLADIFEALTASDRPYKKAKPLSVAIEILHKMCLDDHVDIEVFRLFLTSGTHLAYAQKFLPDSQIDHVDIEQYLDDNAA